MIPVSRPLTPARHQRLLSELVQALELTSAEDVRSWGLSCAVRLGRVTWRRGRNLGMAVARLVRFLGRQVMGAATAARVGELRTHLSEAASAAGSGTKDALGAFADAVHQVVLALICEPRRTAPRLFGGVLGFLAGSGGVDGDGGIPDADLMLGIQNHRSIFTHSVLPGIVIETAVLSLLELVQVIHANLPREHDPLWDELVAGGQEVAEGLHRGVSYGIAYHLGVDATVDGMGTYADLPISLPMEGHQAVAAAGALVEGVDAASREDSQATGEPAA
ncbi:hypothetical protein ACFL6X_06960 [Candidatus Latescibacterota bacterium]